MSSSSSRPPPGQSSSSESSSMIPSAVPAKRDSESDPASMDLTGNVDSNAADDSTNTNTETINKSGVNIPERPDESNANGINSPGKIPLPSTETACESAIAAEAVSAQSAGVSVGLHAVNDSTKSPTDSDVSVEAASSPDFVPNPGISNSSGPSEDSSRNNGSINNDTNGNVDNVDGDVNNVNSGVGSDDSLAKDGDVEEGSKKEQEVPSTLLEEEDELEEEEEVEEEEEEAWEAEEGEEEEEEWEGEEDWESVETEIFENDYEALDVADHATDYAVDLEDYDSENKKWVRCCDFSLTENSPPLDLLKEWKKMYHQWEGNGLPTGGISSNDAETSRRASATELAALTVNIAEQSSESHFLRWMLPEDCQGFAKAMRLMTRARRKVAAEAKLKASQGPSKPKPTAAEIDSKTWIAAEYSPLECFAKKLAIDRADGEEFTRPADLRDTEFSLRARAATLLCALVKALLALSEEQSKALFAESKENVKLGVRNKILERRKACDYDDRELVRGVDVADGADVFYMGAAMFGISLPDVVGKANFSLFFMENWGRLRGGLGYDQQLQYELDGTEAEPVNCKLVDVCEAAVKIMEKNKRAHNPYAHESEYCMSRHYIVDLLRSHYRKCVWDSFEDDAARDLLDAPPPTSLADAVGSASVQTSGTTKEPATSTSGNVDPGERLTNVADVTIPSATVTGSATSSSAHERKSDDKPLGVALHLFNMAAENAATMYVSPDVPTTSQDVRDFLHEKFEYPSKYIFLSKYCPEDGEDAEIPSDAVILPGTTEDPAKDKPPFGMQLQYCLGTDPAFSNKPNKRFLPTTLDEAFLFWANDGFALPDSAEYRREHLEEVADWQPISTKEKNAKRFLMSAFWLESKRRDLIHEDAAYFTAVGASESVVAALFSERVQRWADRPAKGQPAAYSIDSLAFVVLQALFAGAAESRRHVDSTIVDVIFPKKRRPPRNEVLIHGIMFDMSPSLPSATEAASTADKSLPCENLLQFLHAADSLLVRELLSHKKRVAGAGTTTSAMEVRDRVCFQMASLFAICIGRFPFWGETANNGSITLFDALLKFTFDVPACWKEVIDNQLEKQIQRRSEERKQLAEAQNEEPPSDADSGSSSDDGGDNSNSESEDPEEQAAKRRKTSHTEESDVVQSAGNGSREDGEYAAAAMGAVQPDSSAAPPQAASSPAPSESSDSPSALPGVSSFAIVAELLRRVFRQMNVEAANLRRIDAEDDYWEEDNDERTPWIEAPVSDYIYVGTPLVRRMLQVLGVLRGSVRKSFGIECMGKRGSHHAATVSEDAECLILSGDSIGTCVGRIFNESCRTMLRGLQSRRYEYRYPWERVWDLEQVLSVFLRLEGSRVDWKAQKILDVVSFTPSYADNFGERIWMLCVLYRGKDEDDFDIDISEDRLSVFRQEKTAFQRAFLKLLPEVAGAADDDYRHWRDHIVRLARALDLASHPEVMETFELWQINTKLQDDPDSDPVDEQDQDSEGEGDTSANGDNAVDGDANEVTMTDVSGGGSGGGADGLLDGED